MTFSKELEQVLEATTDNLKSCPETLGVIFHGSYLRGDHHAESDIDILCLTDADWISLEVRDILGYKVEIQRNPIRKAKVDIRRHHPANNNFHLSTLILGKVLFERDGALAELLSEAEKVWKQGPPPAKALELTLCRNSLRNRLKTLRQMQHDPEAEGLMRVLADVLFHRLVHDYCTIHRRWCLKFTFALAAIEEEAPEIYRHCERFLQAKSGPDWLAAMEDLADAILEPVGWGEAIFDTGRRPMSDLSKAT